MSAFLTLDSVSAATPDAQVLFEALSFSVGRERVGLVGRNGSGKSTLLNLIAGGLEPRAGTIHRAGRIGVLAQSFDEGQSAAEALGIAEAQALLIRIERGEGSPADFDAADWTLDGRIQEALAKVGLSGLDLNRAIATLSGGERTRLALARLLIEAPDLLLLDEPTNNLDAAGRALIGDFIRDFRGGVLVASHDRALLEHMDRIVELTPIGVHVFSGGWSAFAEARAAERAAAAQDLERAQNSLDNTQRAMQRRREAKDRRDKAGRAFAAKKSEPAILLGAMAERAENTSGGLSRLNERQAAGAEAKLEAARERVEILTPLTIELPSSGLPSTAEVLTMDNVSVRAAAQLLGPWSLRIRGPERIAIRGPNGAGKTTLLRTAIGVTRPDSGEVRRAEGRLVMLDQHVGILDPTLSVLDNFLKLNPSLNQQAAYAACARFAFRNVTALKRVGDLSGGERLRAGLACTLAGARPPWLLILDEPTNHLDLDSIETLEGALQAFDGALLIVSHDAAFLEAAGVTKSLELSRS